MSGKNPNSEHLRLGRYLAGKLTGTPYVELSQKQMSEDLEIPVKSIKPLLDRYFIGLFDTETYGSLSLYKHYSFEDFQETRRALENEVRIRLERSR